ncbi:hypothetical protein Prudu_011933, partial [Prunus dulcis]
NLGIPLAPLRRARRKESVDTEWARIGVTLRETGHRLPEGAGAASSSNGHGTDGVGTAIESPTFSTDINPGAALSWPENRAPGADRLQKRPSRVEAIEVRGIHHRASQSFRTTKKAELISAVGTIRSASLSPSRPDRPPPVGHPELIGKPCFPTEVRPSSSELPAQNSPSFLHQIDRVRHQEPDRTAKETFKGSKFARTICHRSTRDPPPGPFKASATPRKVKFLDWSKYRGDSAEISAEV